VADELHREVRLRLKGLSELRKGPVLLGIVGLIPPHDEVGGPGTERGHDQRSGEEDGPSQHGTAP
jgi:hypothetical protein